MNLQVISIEKTAPACPSNVPIRSPVSENQTAQFIDLPFDAVNKRSPSLLNNTWDTGLSCPFKIIGF